MKITNHLKTIFITTVFFLINTIFAEGTKEYEQTFEFNANGTINIETYKGTISVDTWDKEEVYFHAKVEPDTDGWGPTSTSPQEQLNRCEVRYNHSKNYLSLKSDYRNKNFGSNTLAFVHYTIKMPRGTELKIDDYKSEIEIKNSSARLKLETYKGSVDLINFSGGLVLETYKGIVRADLSELTDNIEFDTFKGDIALRLPSSSGFNIDFDLGKKGDYDSDFDMVVNGYSGDDIEGRVNGGGHEISFSTYKGSIELNKR